jgi:hypothetical protein
MEALPRQFTIRESSHRIHNALTPEKLAVLGRRCDCHRAVASLGSRPVRRGRRLGRASRTKGSSGRTMALVSARREH